MSTSSVQDRLPTESLPSFFEDTGYQVAKPRPPSYCRPATPTSVIHSRLPPLRKAKSSGYGLLNRGDRRHNCHSMDAHHPVGLGFQDFALWTTHRDKNMPSPLTQPRDPPPVPGTGAARSSESGDPDVNLPPAYVYERRGSATSNSTGSTRSNSSLSARLSNFVGLALPSKMRMRGRSKLNLSIATGSEEASADSSPSTLSSSSPPSTPSSPISPFSHAQAQVYSASADDHVLHSSSMEAEEDALAIGRVLTPEADPFAKADIVLPVHGTPGRLIPITRRASSQDSPSSYNRVVTWDDQGKPHPMKRVRNSLPASPVSVAQTFPSSCSVYSSYSPGSHTSYTFPARLSPAQTPKWNGPPSAWTPFANSTPSRRPATSPSPTRSPSKSALKRGSQTPPSPTRVPLPAPPTTVPPPFPPPSLPPPDWALPSVPSSSLGAPPVPPGDRRGHVARGHQSLPPSPHTSHSPTRASRSHSKGYSKRIPSSIVPLSLALQDCSIKALADRRQVVETEVPPSLGKPWSGTIGNTEGLTRPMTPVLSSRADSRRRSTDSTSTITASPSSSALHDATQGWECGMSSTSGDDSVLNEGDSSSVEAFSAPSEAEVEFWSPPTSQSTVFYSACSSVEALEQGRAQTTPIGRLPAPRIRTWCAGRSEGAGTYV